MQGWGIRSSVWVLLKDLLSLFGYTIGTCEIKEKGRRTDISKSARFACSDHCGINSTSNVRLHPARIICRLDHHSPLGTLDGRACVRRTLIILLTACTALRRQRSICSTALLHRSPDGYSCERGKCRKQGVLGMLLVTWGVEISAYFCFFICS